MSSRYIDFEIFLYTRMQKRFSDLRTLKTIWFAEGVGIKLPVLATSLRIVVLLTIGRFLCSSVKILWTWSYLHTLKYWYQVKLTSIRPCSSSTVRSHHLAVLVSVEGRANLPSSSLDRVPVLLLWLTDWLTDWLLTDHDWLNDWLTGIVHEFLVYGCGAVPHHNLDSQNHLS